jgi:hypothetical protein
MVILNVGTGLALDRKTGAVIWQHEGLAGLATPVLYLEAGQPRVLIFGGRALFARDPRTGDELWSIPWETRLAANCCDPVYHDVERLAKTLSGRIASDASLTACPTSIAPRNAVKVRSDRPAYEGVCACGFPGWRVDCLLWFESVARSC